MYYIYMSIQVYTKCGLHCVNDYLVPQEVNAFVGGGGGGGCLL